MFQGEEEKEGEIKRNLFLQSIFFYFMGFEQFFFFVTNMFFHIIQQH